MIIAPGQTFSFLSPLGPITKANGYLEGLTIQGDATVPGIGGGVYQVSTTAFRAAFFAGLPIVERHQHTYRVSYYEQDGSPTASMPRCTARGSTSSSVTTPEGRS